jgi:hypothetical protein
MTEHSTTATHHWLGMRIWNDFTIRIIKQIKNRFHKNHFKEL